MATYDPDCKGSVPWDRLGWGDCLEYVLYTDELGSSEVVGHPANARDADDSRLFWFLVVNPTMNGSQVYK